MIASILAATSMFALPYADIRVNMHILERLPNSTPETAAELQVFTDPDGSVLTCEVLRVAGKKAVAEAMCKLLMKQKLKPGQNFDGDKAFALSKHSVAISPGPSSKKMAQLGPVRRDGLILSINRLPKTAKGEDIAVFPLNLEINAAGEVARCEGAGDLPDAYVEVACGQVKLQGFSPMNDAEGRPVSYVRGFEVIFEIDKP